MLRFFHGRWVVGLHFGPLGPQGFHQHPAGGFAHVIGVGLEGQTPQSNGFALQIAFEIIFDFVKEDLLLRLVSGLDRIQDQRLKSHAVRGFHQGTDVFGKATAAIARTRINEVVANALVAADA